MKGNNIIHLRGMEFFAYHGVLAEEEKLGQRFIVDVDIYPTQWADASDNIK
jgi:dihydroneopterin aldolase